jgi:hypothetical protein
MLSKRAATAILVKIVALMASMIAAVNSGLTALADPATITAPVTSFAPRVEWLETIKASPTLALPTAILAVVLIGADLKGRSLGRLRWATALVTLALAVSIADTVVAVWPYYSPLFSSGLSAFLANLPANDAETTTLYARAGNPFEPAGIALMVAYIYCRRAWRAP